VNGGRSCTVECRNHRTATVDTMKRAYSNTQRTLFFSKKMKRNRQDELVGLFYVGRIYAYSSRLFGK
jgi:hypothetical protein